MLRRVRSMFQLVRSSSWRSNPAVDVSQGSQSQSTSKPNPSDPPKSLSDELSDTAKVLAANEDASAERKRFDDSLQIATTVATEADTSSAPSLPHALAEGYTISAEGHLRAYANAGLVGDETPFHSILRQNPGIAATVKSLHLVLQGPAEIDLARRDSTVATQRKGLTEWARTIPALRSLEKIKVSHLRADEGGVYVPGQDQAEKLALEAERGLFDASMLMKALAWHGEKVRLVQLEAVDMTEEAARAFEGSKITSLLLEACPTRVLTIVPRLPALSEVVITENGDASVGCDYLSLLGHVKATLTAVSLNLRGSKIDLQEFLTTFAGSQLSIIQCPFSTELAPEELEQKLKDAFPLSYGRPAIASISEDIVAEVSTPKKPTITTDSDMELESLSPGDIHDVEMGVISSTNGTPRKAIKRSTIVEKRKEELRIAATASTKEKSKLPGSIRKTRGTPQRQK